jgi:hypothetical protein
MALDLPAFEEQLAGAPLTSPYTFELAVAIVNDCFRLAVLRPPDRAAWDALVAAHPAGRVMEQAGMLAHLVASTRLREETALALSASKSDRTGVTEHLSQFFAEIEPLTGEMIRSNIFRREELVRRWLSHWVPPGLAAVAGETIEQSAKRLEQLDYRATLQEYARAEKAREAEKTTRAKLLKEAQEREAAARGWRE